MKVSKKSSSGLGTDASALRMHQVFGDLENNIF